MVTQQLYKLIQAENRKIMGEFLVTLAVGFGVCALVYGVLFWLSWFAFTVWLRSIRVGSAATSALIVTGLFALASIWSAWRRHDPFENVEAMNPDVQNVQLGLGYALGVPIVNRQSMAGFASLFIGGPANLMDAWAIWRTRPRADAACIAEAAQQLERSRAGIPSRMIDQRAAVVLYRLGLIKAVAQSGGEMIVQPTQKGLELLSSASRPRDRSNRPL
jgi:hypothetical protein